MIQKEEWKKDGTIISPCYPFPVIGRFAEFKSLKRQDISQLLAPLKGKTVLDIGTGHGYFAIYLAQNGASVIALDMSTEMLSIAKENARSAGVEDRISFLQGNADDIPLEDSYIDAIVSVAVITHLPNPRECFEEWSRLLKKGGQLFVDFVPSFSYFSIFFNWTLINPTMKEKSLRFLAAILNESLASIFGFAWGRTRFTNWLYYRFFKIPWQHHTKGEIIRLLQQNGIRVCSIKRYGHLLNPFEFRLYGEKR